MANIFTDVKNFFVQRQERKRYNESIRLAQQLFEKAMKEQLHKNRMAALIDPMSWTAQGQYQEKPFSLSYRLLRNMSTHHPIISAIINTRVNQVINFAMQVDIAQNAQNKAMGFQVVHKYVKKKNMNKAMKRRANEIEDVITKCGYTDRYSTGDKRDTFQTFLKKTVRDRLTFDQVNFEKVLNRKKEVAEFWCVDPETIRIASQQDREQKGIQYVQVINEEVINTYDYTNMAFCVDNPRSDINTFGYGFSELEQLIKIVTAHIYVDQYNTSFFSQGLGIQGILNLVTKDGSIPAEVLEAFKSQFQAQSVGVKNAWKTPVLNTDKLEWINLKPNNRDMEYGLWKDYLIKCACAVYQIDPAEINFNFSGSGSSGSTPMFESSTEAKLKASKDKGLKSILRFIEDFVTEEIVETYDEDMRMVFVGLDEPDEKEVVNIRSQEVKSYKTLDEVRVEAGLNKLGTKKGGDLILDPQYTQFMNMQAMQQGLGQDSSQDSENDNEQFDVNQFEDVEE